MKNKILKYGIYTVTIVGLILCIVLLFPQVRQMIIELVEQMRHKQQGVYQIWAESLLSYAMGGICLILLFDYCTLTDSGRKIVHKVTHEIKECLSEIDFRSFRKPVIIMSVIYLLGILTIMRANFLYKDDVLYAVSGYREWYNWSRYFIVFLSYFVQPEISMTDISPIPQLLAVLVLAVSSVLLVYVLSDKKITLVSLLASIPLGLSPFFLECLSYKFLAVYFALSILVCIIPFLFIARKKAFFVCSVIGLLIMCMTYQAASGIYLIITLALSFNDWNGKRKDNREILLFLGQAVLSFCTAMVIFKLFLMRANSAYDISNAMFSITQIIPGTLDNIKTYTMNINHDLSLIWKAGIVLVFVLFIIKSTYRSGQKKPASFFASILVISLSFIASYGAYSLLMKPLYADRAMFGFGVFLSILCVYVVSDFKKIAVITVLALNWCFFTFAFSYGNALADQKRYASFRADILLQDLSALYPDKDKDKIIIQLSNTIGFTPAVKNIAKHNPIIYRLLSQDECWDNYYFFVHYNYAPFSTANLKIVIREGEPYIDFNTLDLPIVKKTYYHTIRSDGKRVLVELNEGVK